MGSTDYKLDFSTFYNVINNTLTTTPTTRHGVDPGTEDSLPPVPVSTQDDVDQAVRAGQQAFLKWRDLSYDSRAVYLNQFADAIEANRSGFETLLGKETGKPLQGVVLELNFAILHLRETAKLRITSDEKILEDNPERRAAIRFTPLGVGVGIVPWNFPFLLGLGKLDQAVLSGNAFIWKPSPFSPYTALKLGELAAKIFPPGVVQVLSGDETLGPLLTAHPGISKISFTGSSATGKKVMAACAGTLKRVTLELGGNDAAIICDDVDLSVVAPKIAVFCFLHSGQICMNIKRVYVHAKIYDQFLAQMVAVVKTFRTGAAGDETAFSGPVQNAMQFEKLKGLYAEIEKQGWKTALGGTLETPDKKEKGFFMPLTIIDNPPDDSRIVTEEPFGPIVPVLKWSGEEEDDVIRRANDSNMGLGASVWTADLERGERMAKKLEAGSVWVNSHFEMAPHVPFGGHKWSGIGMDWGVEGLKGWCNTQAFWVRKVPN